MRRRALGRKRGQVEGVNTHNLFLSYGFEEASGDVLDLVNGYNIPVLGSNTRQVNGKAGYAMLLNSGYLLMPHSPDFHLRETVEGTEVNQNLAFSFWVYFTGANERIWFFNKRDAIEYEFIIYDGNLRLDIGNTDVTQWRWHLPGHSFALNQWIHLSGHTDIATNDIVIFQNNEVLPGTVSGTPKTFLKGTGRFAIGRNAQSLAFPTYARFDEFRMWKGQTVPNDFSNEWNNGNGISLIP